ncbi:MAG: hypothetical protein HOG34_01650 [Bacteroidetes bacterium]|jgi:hypothetical protein|nr:hypothetical protein [Bacteroidota bacterium]MBT4402018.1 hypothetical protein [Bacteroidota bacterium]
MKTLFSILLILFVSIELFSQAVVKESTFLYKEPTKQSRRIARLDPGQEVELVTKVMNFAQIKAGSKTGFVEYNLLIITEEDFRSEGLQKPISKKILAKTSPRYRAGSDLVVAGNLLLNSMGVGVIGGGISTALILNGKRGGIAVGAVSGGIALVLASMGYSKLISAGSKLKLSPANQGIGVAINF